MHHYQLIGSVNRRIINNVNKLCDMMESLGVTFDEAQSTYNLVSKAVLSEQAENDVLNHATVGKEMHAIFIQERMTGKQSIWEKMKQKKLLTFKSAAKTLKTKLEGQGCGVERRPGFDAADPCLPEALWG